MVAPSRALLSSCVQRRTLELNALANDAVCGIGKPEPAEPEASGAPRTSAATGDPCDSGHTAAGLTVLWGTHLVAFAFRKASRKRQCRDRGSEMRKPSDGDQFSRRELASLFVRALVLTSLGVGLTGFIAPAYANPCCRYSDPDDPDKCVPCTDCSDCCLCDQENCTTGCYNYETLEEQSRCMNRCNAAWLECNKDF
jgi:hypothetical protein